MKRVFANDPVQATKTIQGVTVYIEWPKGSTRTYQRSGRQVLMHADYGYIPKTEGADGEELDVYVGDAVDSPLVFQLHQKDPDNPEFDENKYMIGFKSGEEAKEVYLKHVPENRFGGMEEMNWDNFKKLIAGNRDQQKTAYDPNSSYHSNTPPDSWYTGPSTGAQPDSKYEIGDWIHANDYSNGGSYAGEETDGVIVDKEFYDNQWRYQIDMLTKNEETGAVEQTGDKVWVTDDDISGTLTASLRQAVYLDREGQTLAVGDRVILSEGRDEKPLAHDSQILNVAELYENQEEGGSYVKAEREDGKVVRRISTDFKKITGRRSRAMKRQGKDYNPYSDEWAATDANGVALAEGDVVKNAEPGPNDNPDETYEIVGYSYPQIKIKSTETGEVGFASPSGSVKVGSVKKAGVDSDWDSMLNDAPPLAEGDKVQYVGDGVADQGKIGEIVSIDKESYRGGPDGWNYNVDFGDNGISPCNLEDLKKVAVKKEASETPRRVRTSQRRATKKEASTFRVWLYDVMGNEEDGFQVNDRRDSGHIEIPDASSDEAILQALIEEGDIKPGTTLADITIDGDEDNFDISETATGYPIFGLERVASKVVTEREGAKMKTIKIGCDVFMNDIKMPGYVKMIDAGIMTVANTTYGEKMYAVGDPDVVLVVRRHATNQDELRDLERMQERLKQQKPEAENEEQKESIRIRMEELDREIGVVEAREATDNPNFWNKSAEEDISDGNTKKLRSPATKEIGDNGHEELKEFLPEGEPGEGAEFRHELANRRKASEPSTYGPGMENGNYLHIWDNPVSDLGEDSQRVEKFNARVQELMESGMSEDEAQHKVLEEFPALASVARGSKTAEESQAPTMGGMPENVEQAMDQPGIGPVKFAEESDVQLDPDIFDADKQREEIEKKLKKQEDADTEAEEGEGTDFNQGGFQSTEPFVGPPAMPGQVM